MNLGRGAFEAMAHVVSLVHRSLEAVQDTRGHCPMLAAYVYYAFRLPGAEPSLPSGGKCGGNPGRQEKAEQSNSGPGATQACTDPGNLQEREHFTRFGPSHRVWSLYT